jgi:hypothetical protein
MSAASAEFAKKIAAVLVKAWIAVYRHAHLSQFPA